MRLRVVKVVRNNVSYVIIRMFETVDYEEMWI